MKTLALIAALLAPVPAAATCLDHAAMQERLADGWGESRQSIGLDSRGTVMETYANLETGTWTLAATPPGGLTCIIAAGQHFEAVAEALVHGEGV